MIPQAKSRNSTSASKRRVNSVTLYYENGNRQAKLALNYLLNAGIFTRKAELTPFEKSLEDIKAGRVTRVKNIDRIIEEILQ